MSKMKDHIRCIIVDDEPLSLETLESYIFDFPKLELVSKCRDAFEALNVLKVENIDLVFLDINMPKLSGMSLLKSLENPPMIIFTTAYSEYAVEGFEMDAIDYLLKPFSFERFVKAVNKAFDRLSHKENILPKEDDFLMIKSDKRMFRLKLSEIKYFQSNGDYLKVVCTDKSIVSHQTLKGIAEIIPETKFIRIHKSYIVSLKHLSYVEGNQIKVADEFLPIGLTYKENLLKKLQGRN
jgi:DNA-binding LytR/AlgR family response regulator